MSGFQAFEVKILVRDEAILGIHPMADVDNIRLELTNALEGIYGDEALDLCYVTYEGPFGEDETREGWGLSDEELWDRIPGETTEDKREYMKRAAEDLGIELEDDDGSEQG